MTQGGGCGQGRGRWWPDGDAGGVRSGAAAAAGGAAGDLRALWGEIKQSNSAKTIKESNP